ncbi:MULTISPECIES: helix-turn-helix transcriptional regulator [unclassified Brevundimonas]|uniref:helix-turn-helix domain-containing protein n=1 Tax=unclassified Brevundimonas TaxID=2622653 RepID=UPI0014319ADA|nr:MULTISPECIES: helix-turn-helix transcriptional regulator [unclassified Brevundimonas]
MLPLSPRQRDCIEMAARGLTDKEIAAQLDMSPRTVGAHLSEAYARLGVSNRRDAMRALGIDYVGQTLPMAEPPASVPPDLASADTVDGGPRVWKAVFAALPEPPGRRMRLMLILLVAIGVAVLLAGIVLIMATAMERAGLLAPGNAL